MEDTVAEFEEKGVVVVPNMFSTEEIEEMRREADYIAGVSLNAVRFSNHQAATLAGSRSGSCQTHLIGCCCCRRRCGHCCCGGARCYAKGERPGALV